MKPAKPKSPTAKSPTGKASTGTVPARSGAGPRHFLDLAHFSGSDLRRLLDLSASLKAGRRRDSGRRSDPPDRPLAGRFLAMVFDRPSTRTRVSFDVAMRELGGETIMLTGQEMQLGRGETIADTARVLSRYVDGIMIRILDHAMLAELAAHATVPVINGLTRVSHPCQVMADVLTFEEHRGPIGGRTVAWTGDSNNVLSSWVEASARLGFRLQVASPAELAPRPELLAWAAREGADVAVTTDPYAAVEDADAIVTDCWVSMGDEDETNRHNLLAPYQVNERLMAASRRDPIFMHCLPAHRGEEVTAAVIDGPRSVVFDEAENRLHAQKGILAWCLGAAEGGADAGGALSRSA